LKFDRFVHLLLNVFLSFKFDDGKAVLDKDITSSAIVGFVRTESLPLVIEFTHESAQKIFSGEIKNHLLIFVGKSAADAEKITGAAREAAKEHKGKVSSARYASPELVKLILIVVAGFVRHC
jgi:protein disulfide-isomerase A1